MESLRFFILFGLTAIASSTAICGNSFPVDNGRGQFWACVDIRRRCITAHVRYPGISPNPTITFCRRQNSDGSVCLSVTSNNICSDIPLQTTLTLTKPDFSRYFRFSAGFQNNPPKVCFSGPINECRTEEHSLPASSALLSDADRKEIVNRHNYLRQRVNPSAANMKKMSYDLKLERFAQGYLDRLSDCPVQHNPDNRAYGENVYFGVTNSDSDIDYARIVQLWYREAQNYDYESNSCSRVCGHYTQVAWGDTEKVGCATKQCRNGHDVETLVICNYDPPGNFRSQKPYTSGGPCSSCPSTHPFCKDKLCVKSLEDKQTKTQVSNWMKFFGHTNSNGPSPGAQEWEMGPKETVGERPGELSSVSEVDRDGEGGGGGGIEFEVYQEMVPKEEEEGWIERVVY